jgi:hypothetical protein
VDQLMEARMKRHGTIRTHGGGMVSLLLFCALAASPWFACAQVEEARKASSRIQTITEGTKTGGIPARLAALRALRGKTLQTGEIEALWAFLAKTPEETGIPMRNLNHLRNDILTVLVRHSPAVPDLVPRLCAMYRDTNQDRTWRDYCIQFLGQFYPRADEHDRERARDLFLEAAKMHANPTAGTALIALSNNIDSPGIDREEIAQPALAIASDPEASPGARMTAMQICARHHTDAVLPHARDAASGKTAKSITVRMAATAALGTLGDESDRDLLGKLSRSAETRLRRAALGALRRLDAQATAD